MTLGPALLILRWFESEATKWTSVLMAYGRVPLFYFAAHFFLIHAAAAVTCLVRYGTWHWMFESPNIGAYPFTRPPDWGYSLPVVYAVWSIEVVSLWPAWLAGVQMDGPAQGEARASLLELPLVARAMPVSCLRVWQISASDTGSTSAVTHSPGWP